MNLVRATSWNLRREQNKTKIMAEEAEPREGNIEPGGKSMCERIAVERLGKE